MLSDKELDRAMNFDHVIEVLPDGSISGAPASAPYPPDVYNGEIYGLDNPWKLLSGFSGQYGYSGPGMHTSEHIGGRMAEHITTHPGIYVAVVDYDYEGDESGWVVAFMENSNSI